MARSYQINDAARSLDQQQSLDWLRGWQVVDPGGGSNAVSAGTGSFEYDAAAGDINAGGSIVTCSQETVDFAADIDASDDKMAVIYRDASGTLQKSVGAAGTRDPSGSDPRNTHTPPPPTLHNTNGVVLAEVLLPAGASSIGADEFRDRRDPAEVVVNALSAQKLSRNLDADGNDITGVGSLGTGGLDTALEDGTDVSASRSLDSEFENTTGEMIMVTTVVSAGANGTRVGLQLRVTNTSGNGSQDTQDEFRQTIESGDRAAVTGLVPNGAFYEVNSFDDTGSFSVERWNERGFTS